MAVGSVDGPVGAGHDNGSDNDNSSVNDTMDTSIDTVTTDEDEVEDSVVENTVNGIADAVEDATGIPVSDDMRESMVNAVKDKGVEGLTEAVDAVVSAAGFPASKEIAKAITEAVTNPEATQEEVLNGLLSDLAKMGLSAMSPMAESLFAPVVDVLTDDSYGVADLMGDLAGLMTNVAGHSALAAIGMGSMNAVAAPVVAKGADYVDDTVTAWAEDAIANGDVVNPGEDGYAVSHGPGHDKSTIILPEQQSVA